jgi:hypothetical protein
MGGIMSPTKEEEVKKFLRLDDSKRLESFLKDNQIPSDTLYTKYKRTLLQLSCYYESPKCLSKLIEMDYDYNKIEESNGNTPLFVSCKFNCLKLVKILLSHDDCKKLVKNNENFNEFDIAFLKGNYSICYYLLYEYKKKENNSDNDNNEVMKESNNNEENNNIDNENEINTNMNIDKHKNEENENNNNFDINQIYQKYFFNNNFDIDYYLSLQESNTYPLFNMQLFYRSLCRRIPPEKCESFAPERKRTKELLTKIPDPNETWGHFFKRIANLELYNPPLVDKKNVSQMNSIYMNTQMKLIESEYGVKLNYYKPEDEENNNQDEDEEKLIRVRKKKNPSRGRNDNKINDEEKEKEKEENNINNKDGNICVIKVNDYSSSSRSINKEDNK